jgi:hypothetical protein
MLKMIQPKKVILFNPETGKKETWSWMKFTKYVEEWTSKFEDAGIDLSELEEPAPEQTVRPKYDH